MNRSKKPISRDDLFQLLQFVLSISYQKTDKPINKILAEIILAFGVSLVTFGFTEMINGLYLAPWFVAFGFFLVAVRVMLDDAMKQWLLRFNTFLRNTFRVAVCVVLCFLLPLWGFNVLTQHQIESLAKSTIFYAGELTPGDEGITSTDEQILNAYSTGQYIVMLGDGSAVFINGSEACNLCDNNVPFLSLTIGSDGGLSLNASISDNTGHEVVKITNNSFTTNPAYAFEPRMPDSHTLIVNDSRKVQVLEVQYLNTRVIRIVGTFYLAGKKPLIISPDGTLQIEGNIFHHFYTSGNPKADINIE